MKDSEVKDQGDTTFNSGHQCDHLTIGVVTPIIIKHRITSVEDNQDNEVKMKMNDLGI